MKISINIPDDLLSKIDEQSKKLYLSRSAYIATALAQKLQADVITESLPDILQEIKNQKNQKQ